MSVVNRTAEGLPFVVGSHMRVIIEGILAKAQSLYPVTVCHLLFMMNHYHGIVICNPKTLSDFMGYFQGELAKCVNRFTGRCNQNVWAGRYCAQPILTPKDVITEITYLYANPCAANLAERPGDWLGVSTWDMYQQGKFNKSCKWICSSQLSKLPVSGFSVKLQEKLKNKLLAESTEEHTWQVDPYAWMSCFEETLEWSNEEADSMVRAELKEATSKYHRSRLREGIKVASAEALLNQSIYRRFKSQNYGKRALCICRDLDLRKRYVEAFRNFHNLCKQAWLSWKQGDFSAKYPPGAFRPSLPILQKLSFKQALGLAPPGADCLAAA